MSRSAWVSLASSDAGAQWNCQPASSRLVLRCDSLDAPAKLLDRGQAVRTWNDPLAAIGWMADDSFRAHARLPGARWIGYLGYDLAQRFERLPRRALDDLHLPLFCFSLHEPSETRADPPPNLGLGNVPLSSTFTRSAYESAVAAALEYIAAGDIFQVNLSQRFSAGLRAQPREIFGRMQRQSPARYGACLCYDDEFALLSNSPELFLRIEPRPDGSRRILTRPIKGTRPRAPGMEQELRESVKDQAELNMIVDLERNDLGRVCEIGSVNVIEPRTIESHPTVYHGVATIQGTLRKDVRFLDLLGATFPGGSVTGAPKIRAMQIIDELEPVRRGAYCGAIGYFADDGSVEFNIAIRTMTARSGQIHIPVGGGIVADSSPAAEYEETLVKARAMFDAVGLSCE